MHKSCQHIDGIDTWLARLGVSVTGGAPAVGASQVQLLAGEGKAFGQELPLLVVDVRLCVAGGREWLQLLCFDKLVAKFITRRLHPIGIHKISCQEPNRIPRGSPSLTLLEQNLSPVQTHNNSEINPTCVQLGG